MPVVKLFTPDTNCTWLLVELDPRDDDIAFGLCDLGLGSPELGNVCISELETVRGRLGLPVERDRRFDASKTLSDYAVQARLVGVIKAYLSYHQNFLTCFIQSSRITQEKTHRRKER